MDDFEVGGFSETIVLVPPDYFGQRTANQAGLDEMHVLGGQRTVDLVLLGPTEVGEPSSFMEATVTPSELDDGLEWSFSGVGLYAELSINYQFSEPIDLEQLGKDIQIDVSGLSGITPVDFFGVFVGNGLSGASRARSCSALNLESAGSYSFSFDSFEPCGGLLGDVNPADFSAIKEINVNIDWLVPNGTLSIQEIRITSAPRIKEVRNRSYPASKNGHEFFSIPPAGSHNVLQREMRVEFEEIANPFDIETATIELLDPAGMVLDQIVLDEAAGDLEDSSAYLRTFSVPNEDSSKFKTYADVKVSFKWCSSVSEASPICTGQSPENPSGVNVGALSSGTGLPDVIGYRMIFAGTVGSTTGSQESQSSIYAFGDQLVDPEPPASFRALWEIPDSVPRFGPHNVGTIARRVLDQPFPCDKLANGTAANDIGGDSWAAPGTVEFIQDVGVFDPIAGGSGALPAINDVSGEHGKNICHDTHQYGLDLDTYHYLHVPPPFRTLPQPPPANPPELMTDVVNGKWNYKRLLKWAEFALTADPVDQEAIYEEAVQRVSEFVQAQRAGLDLLAQDFRVIVVGIGKGSPEKKQNPALANGWLKKAMLDGELGVNLVSEEMVTVGSPWQPTCFPGCVVFWSGHNDHNHVRLWP